MFVPIDSVVLTNLEKQYRTTIPAIKAQARELDSKLILTPVRNRSYFIGSTVVTVGDQNARIKFISALTSLDAYIEFSKPISDEYVPNNPYTTTEIIILITLHISRKINPTVKLLLTIDQTDIDNNIQFIDALKDESYSSYASEFILDYVDFN